MPSSRFLHLAATRPIVPLAAGFLVVAALLAIGVAVQSGFGPGLASFAVNLVIFAPAFGLNWLTGRILARRAPAAQAWWVTRAQGYLLGFIGAVAVAGVPLFVVMRRLGPTQEAAPMPGSIGLLVAVLAAVNAVPLLLALAIEGVARRRLR